MITVDAAEILGLNIGSLEPGRDADFIVIDTTWPNMTPTRVNNVVENIIWSATGAEVRYVVANGRVLLNDYCFTTLNRDEIIARITEMTEIFCEHADILPPIQETGAHGAGACGENEI